ncbi:MAG: hypothetical protein JXR96_15885 [Deltaproteobacteria bacterium]|nr:hypothetical protein [Deltaproteobacteria bacterium]
MPVRGARARRPVLSLVRLAHLEEEIGARLHDDVLALLAIRDPVAGMVTGIESLESVAEAAEDYTAPDGCVRIGWVYSDPIGERMEGAHGGPYVDIVSSREPEGEEARVHIALDGQLEGAEEQSLGAYIEGVLTDALSGQRDALSILGNRAAVPLDPPPQLIAGVRPKAPEMECERGQHPKFGMGIVIKRLGSGRSAKVVVAFADQCRTILSRYVQTIDDEME